jgi:hypothetical protein
MRYICPAKGWAARNHRVRRQHGLPLPVEDQLQAGHRFARAAPHGAAVAQWTCAFIGLRTRTQSSLQVPPLPFQHMMFICCRLRF